MDQLLAAPDSCAQVHSTPHIILWWSKSKPLVDDFYLNIDYSNIFILF